MACTHWPRVIPRAVCSERGTTLYVTRSGDMGSGAAGVGGGAVARVKVGMWLGVGGGDGDGECVASGEVATVASCWYG